MCCNNWSGTSTATSVYANTAASSSSCCCGRSRVVGFMPIVATYQMGSPVWNNGSSAAAADFSTASGYDYDNYNSRGCGCGCDRVY